MTIAHASAPRDFETLKALIVARKGDLPRRLMQVALHALERPDDVAFGTAASIAAAARVQPSTLVRFAQHFGYEGFSDLQLVFRERLRERVASYDERLFALRAGVARDSSESTIVQGFLHAAERSIAALADELVMDRFEEAIGLLARADTIYLLGQRRSFPVSSYMAYAFGKLAIRTVLTGSAMGIDEEILAAAGPRDAAIAVSFPPYASTTVHYARQLAGQDVPIVAITDSALCDLADLSAIRLDVVEADFSGFRSLSASMALAMALTVCVAERRSSP